MTGKLTVVVGSMGSGKTERLIDDFLRLVGDGSNVAVFKPSKDTREGSLFVRSRSGRRVPSMAINRLDDIYYFEDPYDKFDAVLIDEIQFFEESDLYSTMLSLLITGVDIYVYGLDVTSEDATFGQMGDLMAHADEVIKIQAKCSRCDNPARISHYLGEDKDDTVKIGDLDVYSPLCRECYYLDVVGEENMHIPDEEFYDEILHLSFQGDDVTVELMIPESELGEVGYTREQLVDIDSPEGVRNLLIDLGYEGV